MRRRVIPAGDSLKDFHWAGGEAWTESERPTVPTLYAPGGLMTSRFAGRVTHENFTVPEGTSLRRPLITISRIKNS